MYSRWLVLLFVSAAAVAPGCLDGLGASQPTSAASSMELMRPVVIAVLDTGINPYHEAFRAETAPVGPVSATTLSLAREGNYEDRVAADASILSSVVPGGLYHFAGTRIYGVTFAPTERGGMIDENSHGTATAAAVLQSFPDALIVAVQVNPLICTSTECIVHPSVAEGMTWIAQQDWVDIVSISMNLPGNVPDSPTLHTEMQTFVAASKAAAASGKLIVNSAGNEVGPPLLGYFAGPPWIIAVGGVEAYSGGEAKFSGRGVDVVGNYSAYLPTHDSLDQYAWRAGTSFAAPAVAGTLGGALAEIRDASYENFLPSLELRHAMNASATYFAPLDWDPTANPRPQPTSGVLYSTLPIVVPEAQMGWGYLDGSHSKVIAARVLAGEFEPPAEKTRAALVQAAWQDLRTQYWANAAP